MHPNQTRLEVLDVFRGFAALSVVFFHLSIPNNALIFVYGNTAVDFFFIISGFVIFMSLTKTTSITSFWRSRFFRLYPVYWISILVALITYYIFKPTNISIKALIGNMLMMQPAFRVENVVDAYWTLYVELNFYLVMSGVWYLNKLRGIENTLFIAIALSGLINGGYLFYQNESETLTRFFITTRGIFPLISHFHMFAAGIAFYKIFKEGISLKRFLLLVVCFLMVPLTHDIGGKIFYFMNALEHSLCIIVYFILMALLINNKLELLQKRILVFFGTISYSLYVIHQSAGLYLSLYISKLSNPYIGILAGTSFSILIAFYITHLLEIPILRWAKKK